MNFFHAIVFSAFAVGLAYSQNGVPSFAWSHDEVSSHGVPLLIINFHDGKPNDAAELKQFNPIPRMKHETEESVDNCIFQGFLRDEPKSFVTVTGGCPFDNSFDIQFHSSRATEHMFQVKESKAEAVISTYRTNKNFVPDVALQVPEEFKTMPVKAESQPNGVVFNIKFFFDQTLKGVFGDDSVNVLRRVVAQAQNIYYYPTLPTIVTLQVGAVEEIFEYLNADQNTLNILGNYANDISYNSFFVLTNRYDASPAAGLAYVNVVCSGAMYYRTGVSEYYNNDLESAEYLAHELGHNLGFNHDFLSSPSEYRYDSQGNVCTGIRGVMDYSARDKWTTCSYEDYNISDHSCMAGN